MEVRLYSEVFMMNSSTLLIYMEHLLIPMMRK